MENQNPEESFFGIGMTRRSPPENDRRLKSGFGMPSENHSETLRSAGCYYHPGSDNRFYGAQFNRTAIPLPNLDLSSSSHRRWDRVDFVGHHFGYSILDEDSFSVAIQQMNEHFSSFGIDEVEQNERNLRSLRANLHRMRVQSAVNGHMGFEAAQRYSPGSSAGVVTSESWNGNASITRDRYFLQRKKQLPTEIKSQLSIMGCGNRTESFIDSNGDLYGLPKGFSLQNLYTSRSESSNHHHLDGLSDYLNSSLIDLRGWVVTLAKDRYGCRFLEAKLEHANGQEVEMILSEVIDCVGSLMQDQFGNNLFQKLVKFCKRDQRIRIIQSVTKAEFQLVSICLNTHGAQSVQKLLKHLTSQLEISLVMSALGPGAATLANDQTGHCVIEHCLNHLSNEDNTPLLNEIANNCFEIATNKSGCCVLQSCILHSQGEVRKILVSEIITNALLLAEHPYGNYVVQHILGLQIPEFTKNLLRRFEGRYFTLSCNKYASHVVEKSLLELGEEQSSSIIMELLSNPRASILLQDPFGNFVIQSALSVSQGFCRSALLDLIQLNAPLMRSNLYGKKILSRCDKMLRLRSTKSF